MTRATNGDASSSLGISGRPKEPPQSIRLICMDIDGTLLDSESRIRAGVRSALERACEDGIHIVLATGRNLDSTLPVVEQLGLHPAIISSTGAHTRTMDGQTSETPLEYRQARGVMRIGLWSGSGLFVDHPTRSWNLGNSAYVSMFLHVTNGTPARSMEETLTPLPLKVSVINRKDTLGAVRLKITRLYPGLQLASPFDTVLDVTPPGVNKGSALRALAERLGIPLSQVAAIGDSENDLSDMQISGLSIAMLNSPEHVRLAADWLAPSNDDEGVAWAVDRILANNSKIPSSLQ